MKATRFTFIACALALAAGAGAEAYAESTAKKITGRTPPPQKSLTYTCSESWCRDMVMKFCDKNGGGLSTNPDGSIACTIHEKGPVVIGSFRGPVQPPHTGRGTLTSGPKKPARSGLEVTCSAEWCMKSIVAGCDKNGGGLSTNPDGSVTCSL